MGRGGAITFAWLVYIRDATASKSGKPPPESAPCVHATGALKCMLMTHKKGRKNILVTDCAQCYPKLTSENNLGHEVCNHSKGIFCIKKGKTWGRLLVHTGGIDGVWKISKGAVSSSWSTRKHGAVNHHLLQGIRIWQRRWHHGNCKDYMSLTGHALSNAWQSEAAIADVKSDHHPKATKPVNTMWSLQNDFILPGNFFRNVDQKNARRHSAKNFFQNVLNR